MVYDNLIQRDVLSNYPVINSTSLKGALKEYFDKVKYAKSPEKDEVIKKVFGMGNEKVDGKEDDKMTNIPGKFCFFNANILSIPARSDKFPFLNVTTIPIINDLLKQFDLLKTSQDKIIEETSINTLKKLSEIGMETKSAICFEKEYEGAMVEFYNIKTDYKSIFSEDEITIIKKWFGERPVILNTEIFKNNISEKLPIIARNHLNNGQSVNLWYEEILPRESRFYAFISATDEDWKNIDFSINSIQIGGNSSVGYGYSKMFQIN